MADQPQPKTRRGCFFYGCMVGLVFALLVLAGLLIGARYAKKMIYEFTDANPMTLPTVNLSSAQMDALRQRVNTFSNAVVAGKSPEPLTLNSDEVNGLIQDGSGNKGWSGKVYVTLQDDKVKAAVSLPMKESGVRFLRNRYLNGDATLNVSLRNGTLGVFIDQVNVKGKPVPSVYMQHIRQINFAEDANTNRSASPALNKLQAIEVKDGKLIVTPASAP